MLSLKQSAKKNIFSVIIILCSFLHVEQCYNQIEKLDYEDCSTNARCQTCLNEYLCDVCPKYPASYCCPKYCLTCSGDRYCTKCEPGFVLINTINGNKICQNNDSRVDPHLNISAPTLCAKGYYMERTLRFCERCLVPFCKMPLNSITCFACQVNYEVKNGLCVSIFNSNLTKQESQSVYLFLLVMGIALGLCLACIIVKIYSCSKRKCKNFVLWCRNLMSKIKRKTKRERQILINQDKKASIDIQVPNIEDQQIQGIKKKKNSKINKQKINFDNDYQIPREENKPTDILQNHTVNDEQKQFVWSSFINQNLIQIDQNKIKKSVITEAKFDD